MSFNKIAGTLLYVQVNKPVREYVDPKAEKKREPGFEWKASVAVTDAKWVYNFEKHLKSIKAKTSIKKVAPEDFEAAYKCPAPEGATDFIYVLTFRKNTQVGPLDNRRDVPEQYHPKILQKIVKGANVTFLDITTDEEKQVANGSVGAISIDFYQKTDGSNSIYLKNVMVSDLVAWTPREASDYAAGDEFADDSDDETPDGVDKETGEVAPKKAEAKPVKTAPKTTKPVSAQDAVQDDPF